jgi:hypothetical protein
LAEDGEQDSGLLVEVFRAPAGTHRAYGGRLALDRAGLLADAAARDALLGGERVTGIGFGELAHRGCTSPMQLNVMATSSGTSSPVRISRQSAR